MIESTGVPHSTIDRLPAFRQAAGLEVVGEPGFSDPGRRRNSRMQGMQVRPGVCRLGWVRGSSGFDDAGLVCKDDCLDAVAELELGEDV